MADEVARPRLMISNLPKFFNAKSFKKMLQQHKVPNVRKVKHTGKVGFVSFDSIEDFDCAVAILRDAKIKGQTLNVEKADEPKDNFKSNRRDDSKEPPTMAKMLAAVQPLADVAYDDQLVKKNDMCVDNLRSLAKNMRHANCDVESLNTALQPIVPSPTLDGYRNKCELLIGYSTSSVETREAVVGFTHGRRVDDNRQVIWPIDECRLVPDVMKNCAKHFQEYLRAQPLDMYDEASKTGVYRMLTIRSFGIDLMLVVTITAKAGDDVSERVKVHLVNEFGDHHHGGERDCTRGFRVTSLYMAHIVNTSDTPEYVHIDGAPYIYARMLTHRFRLSPDAFFQPNVAGAESMYMTIAELMKMGVERQTAVDDVGTDVAQPPVDDVGTDVAQPPVEGEAKRELVDDDKPSDGEPAAKKLKDNEGSEVKLTGASKEKSLLLDICCGTGTIGIALAQHADLVIGAEICAQAVLDARENATINGRSDKCKYVRGPAEATFRDLKYHLPSVTKDLNEYRVVGIVDPPRAGLHSKLIQALRQTKTLRTIVFCSCDPGAAMKNFVDLCRPTSNSWPETPFSITRIVPVDMFPHTRHYEWVLLLTR